jgi:hypothetical protein
LRDRLDRLQTLRDHCVDLVYIDPAFNSNRNYEVFWGETKEKPLFEGRRSSTQAYIEYMRSALGNGVKRLAYALAAIVLAACATSADQAHWDASLRSAPVTEGVARTFSADLATTLRAAQQAVLTTDLEPDRDCPDSINHDLIVGEHNRCLGPTSTRIDDHTAVFNAMKLRGEGQWWNGEQVRIVVQEAAPGQTTVRVLSRFRTQTIVGRRGDYSAAIFDQISRQLKQ